MKKILLAGSAIAAAFTFASAAQAADVTPAGYDWTGFYLGANAGVAWNNSEVDNSFYVDGVRLNQIDNKIDDSETAFTAGGLLGYNYQIDQIVLGVEADFNYLGFDANGSRKFSDSHPGIPVPLDYKASGSVQTDWFGTIRGRLGYAIDNVLIYGTGGFAYGNVSGDGKVTVSANGTELDSWKSSSDETNWGWTAGGGIEYGFDKWSVGVEYLYVDLGSGDWKDSSVNGHQFNLKGDADYAFSTVRATAKFHF